MQNACVLENTSCTITEPGDLPASRCEPVTAHYLKIVPPDQPTAVHLPFTTRTWTSPTEPTMHINIIIADPSRAGTERLCSRNRQSSRLASDSP